MTAAYLGELYARLAVDTSALDHAVTDLRRMDKMANAAISNTQKRLQAIGGSMKSFGRSMTQFVTLPMGLAGGAALKMYADFEFSMNKVVSLVGIARTQVDAWTKEVLALAPTVGKSPKELADALYFITSAGIRGKETMEILNESARSSAGGLGEVKVIADLLTSAMNAYGKSNLSAAEANDILVATVREGKAEADLLAQSMGLVLPIASAMGASFDQIGAATAAMTRTGTKAATAAIQLRQIFNSLLKPAKEAEEALGTMGSSGEKLRKMIREEGLLAALEELSDLTEEYGINMLGKVIPNIRSLTGILDITGKNFEANKEIFKAIRDSAGDANKMFGETEKTVKFRLNRALARLQVTGVNFGATLSKVIVPIVERFSMFIENLSKRFDALSEAKKRSIVIWGALAVAIGPVITVLGFFVGNVIPGLLTVLKAVKSMVLNVGRAFVYLAGIIASNPFLLIIGGAIAATVALIKYAAQLKEVERWQIKFAQAGIDYDALAEEEVKSIKKRLRWLSYWGKQRELNLIAQEKETKRMREIYAEQNDIIDEAAMFASEDLQMLPMMDLRQTQDTYAKTQRIVYDLEDAILSAQAKIAKSSEDLEKLGYIPPLPEKEAEQTGKFLDNMVKMYGNTGSQITAQVEDVGTMMKRVRQDQILDEQQYVQESLKAMEDHLANYKKILPGIGKQWEALEKDEKKVFLQRSAAFNEIVGNFETQMGIADRIFQATGKELDHAQAQVSAFSQALDAMSQYSLTATGTHLEWANKKIDEYAQGLKAAEERVEQFDKDIVTLGEVIADVTKELEIAQVMQKAFGHEFSMAAEELAIFENMLHRLVEDEVKGAEELIGLLTIRIQQLRYELTKADEWNKAVNFMGSIGEQASRIGDYLDAGIISKKEAVMKTFQLWKDAYDSAFASGAPVEQLAWLKENMEGARDALSPFQKIQVWAEENAKAIGAVAQAFGQLWSSIGQYLSANMERELAMVDEIAKKKNKSDEWVAKEREKIEKEYGKKFKQQAIAQAITSQALAIANVWKHWSHRPVLAGVLTAVAAAATGIQIAAIKATPMYEGGIVPAGYPRDSYPAMLTSGEEVIPAKKRRDDRMDGEVVFRIDGDQLVGILKKRESVMQNY